MTQEEKAKAYDKALTRKLKMIDNKVDDFEDNAIPKVTLTDDCNDEVFDLDMRCTDYGEAMDFFN